MERRVTRADRGPQRRVRVGVRLRGKGFPDVVGPGQEGGIRALFRQQVDREVGQRIVREVRDITGTLGPEQQPVRTRDLQRMHDAGPDEVRVDEGGLDAHLREPAPDRDVLRPVGHHEPDRVARPEPHRQRPTMVRVA